MAETNFAMVVLLTVVARVTLAAVGLVVGTAFPIAVGGAAGMLVPVVASVAPRVVAPVVAGVLVVGTTGAPISISLVRPVVVVGDLVSWLAVFLLLGSAFLSCLLISAALQDVVTRVPTHIAGLVVNLLEGIGGWGHFGAGRLSDIVSDWHCRACVEGIVHFLAEIIDVLAKLIQIFWLFQGPFGFESCKRDRSLCQTLDHDLVL